MDAALPTAERYASLKFRRVARYFDATRLDYPDACELVAFTTMMGKRSSKYIFHWQAAGLRECERLQAHLGGREEVAAMIEANREDLTRADGLAVLAAMRDGGWKVGAVPDVVRMALLDMRDSGMSQPRIADELGLTLDQIRNMANGRRKAAVRLGLAGLVAD